MAVQEEGPGLNSSEELGTLSNKGFPFCVSFSFLFEVRVSLSLAGLKLTVWNRIVSNSQSPTSPSSKCCDERRVPPHPARIRDLLKKAASRSD